MNGRRQMMVFMSLVLVLIGQFCRDVICRQNVKVIAISRLLFSLFSKVGRKVRSRNVWSATSISKDYNRILVPVRTSFSLRRCSSKTYNVST